VIEQADLVFLMDYRNYHLYTRRFPEASDRTFLLRLFEDGPRMQIGDPHGKGPAAFREAYDVIRECVTELVRARTEDASTTVPKTEQ
jgi:protein-tyrosine-phosphatase